MSFETRVDNIHTLHKMVQGELAEKVGMHLNVLGRYERDEPTPSLKLLPK